MSNRALRTMVVIMLVSGVPRCLWAEEPVPQGSATPIGIWFEVEAASTAAQGRAPSEMRAREATLEVLGSAWTTERQTPAESTEFISSRTADGAPPLTAAEAWEKSYDLMKEPYVVRAEPIFLVQWPDDPQPQAQGCWPRGTATPPAASTGSSTPPLTTAARDPEWSLGPRGANVKAAWELLPSNELPGAGIVIAHPDTGFSEHPEIWSGRDGTAGIADWGYDLIDSDPDPRDPLSSGPLQWPGHGTKTASVIISGKGSPVGSSTAWVTGVAPGATLLPLRVAKGVVQFSQARLAAAIDFAANQGTRALRKRVDIISISLGGPPSTALLKAIKRAEAAGILVIAAAGNYVGTVVYPARYDEVISVGASNANGVPWFHSSMGRRIDVVAPGESVWRASSSAIAGRVVDCVETGSGTSYATPTVAGAAALWLQKNRDDKMLENLRRSGRLTATFRNALRASLTVPRGWPMVYGPGIINVEKLLKIPIEHIAAREPVQAPASLACGGALEPVTSLLEESADPQTAVAGLLDTDDPCHAASFAPEIATLYATSPAVRASFAALATAPRLPAALADARGALSAADPSDTLANALKGEKGPSARINLETLVWQSANTSIDDLPAELLQLYRSLDETGTLRTRPHVDGTGGSIEKIMRERKLFFGPAFPRELDALMCRRNDQVCRLQGDQALWTNRPGSTLNLPEVHLAPEILPRPYEKRQGELIRVIAIDRRQGCEAWDDECAGFISYLNKEPIPKMDARAGTVIIPTLLVRARFTLDQWSRELEKRLGDHLISDVSVSAHGVPDDPHFRAQVAIFELIHHPLADGDEDLPKVKTIVGVIDPTVADLACDFETNPANADDKCDQLEETPGDADHATHVAGIIAARINGRGIVGVNPNAKVIAKAVGRADGSSRMNGAEIATSINELLNERADVINISMDYELRSPGADGVKREIKNAPYVLFVVAAGNEAKDITDGCDVWPACFANSLPNVLTVVALDRTKAVPNRWTKAANQGSNYSESFHLGAPGLSVLSTLRNGRVGPISGTSQAAPIVAGAASLILAKNRTLPGPTVRDRLVYSSDFFPTLDKSAVGGRLNVWRALQIEHDLVEYAAGGEARGQLSNRTDEVSFTTADASFKKKLQEFRRIHQADDGTFTVLVRDEVGRLLKFSRVTIEGDPELKLSVTKDGVTKVQPVKLSALRNYTARIPLPPP